MYTAMVCNYGRPPIIRQCQLEIGAKEWCGANCDTDDSVWAILDPAGNFVAGGIRDKMWEG